MFFHWHLTLCKSSPKASDCELEKWIQKVDKEISRYDLTKCPQRETTIFDIGHKNDGLVGLSDDPKNYRYFYLKNIHTPKPGLANTGQGHDFLSEPISQDGLPPPQSGAGLKIYLSSLLDFGPTGLVVKKYDDFTRKSESGEIVVCKCLKCL